MNPETDHHASGNPSGADGGLEVVRGGHTPSNEISSAELRCRRLALGLDQSDLAAMLGVKQMMVSRWETATRPIPAGVVEEITQCEDQQDALTAAYIQSGREFQELYAHPNEEEFWAAQPHMQGIPLAVQHVAVARARRVVNTPIINA